MKKTIVFYGAVLSGLLMHSALCAGQQNNSPLSNEGEETAQVLEERTISPAEPSDQALYVNQPTNSSWAELAVNPTIYESPFKVSLFNPENGEDSARLWSQTKSIAVYGFGVAGALSLMPESVTGWTKDDVKLMNKWGENVKQVAVWDRDDILINMVGHPYSGGIYYQAARKSGYRQWDAFMYSFLMSTFYWEYGIEAFAEVPSIQDLAVTPVLGWVAGEWMFNKEQEIRRRGGKVGGSYFWGGTALFLLDPVDSIGVFINRIAGKQVVAAGTGYLSYNEIPTRQGSLSNTEKELTLHVQYALGKSEKKHYYRRYSSATGDPIDTGVVGFSAGAGTVSLDDKWGYESANYLEWSLGVYFTRALSTRLKYGRDEELRNLETGETIPYENYSLSVQNYFNTDGNTRPYVSAGFGEQMFDKDRANKHFLWNATLGVHHKMSDKWAVQLDWENFYGQHTYSHESALNGRLIYRFGNGERDL